MNNWFECKISYDKIIENGTAKRVTEPYLVDALSFAEAEARITKEMEPFMSGEFTVSDIKRARLSEIFYNTNGDRYYKVKVVFITLDEKSGSEKKTSVNMLAQASTLREAVDVVEEGMKGTMADYVIASITESAIMDIYPYDTKESSDADPQVEVEFEEHITWVKKSLLNNDTFPIQFNDGNITVIFKRMPQGIYSIAVTGLPSDFINKPLKYKLLV